ncbi:hypothetical protein [Oceanispirochaeta sp. M1]|uniref:hypothetical protein n=1 Tax=Oceanispirochaeta sp. M1 TaxID=2283433 RepID=UPI0011C07B40|nr:hypothetical protein [Oceanispirochaeta sp. M1]NPD75585.1 hypothetical protein [Oceanispirochaeta sp. M1]
MGRHKLPYKMKKPNAHHKYWRYVLSTNPTRTEISMFFASENSPLLQLFFPTNQWGISCAI